MAVRLPVGLALLCMGISGSGPARCATVKKFTVPPAEVPVFQAWSKYLTKGPQVWSKTHAPSFTPAIRGTIWQVLKTDVQAESLANPMIDYLLWRQSLNPVRFTANHPNLSPALESIAAPAVRNCPRTCLRRRSLRSPRCSP